MLVFSIFIHPIISSFIFFSFFQSIVLSSCNSSFMVISSISSSLESLLSLYSKKSLIKTYEDIIITIINIIMALITIFLFIYHSPPLLKLRYLHHLLNCFLYYLFFALLPTKIGIAFVFSNFLSIFNFYIKCLSI